MTDVSGLNDSSILRDFSAEYELVCSQNKEHVARLEALNQENHSLRSRLQVSEKIQVELQADLEFQQQQLLDANEHHAAAVLKLKEDHALTVKDFEEKLQGLENAFQEGEREHALDKEELFKTRKELIDLQDSSPVATLKVELQEIMEEHAANRLACIQHQELNKILLNEKANLLEELSSIRETLEMTEEKLKICKGDLTELSETVEELRESLAVAQTELACVKASPAEVGGKGNSLFAEVEDKRQSMLKKCSSLSKKYTEMKKDYGSKCSEISRLKLENLRLRRRWQEEAEERDNRDVWLKDNFNIRIEELTKMVEDLKQEEKPVFVNGDSKILDYAEHSVKEARQKVLQLREEMEWRSSQRLNEAQALYMARSEVQTLKAQVMCLHAENLVLRDKLVEANITDIPSPGKKLKRIKEVMQNADKISSSQTLPSSVTEEGSPSSEDPPQSQTDTQTLFHSIPSAISNISKPQTEIVENLQSECAATSHTPTVDVKVDPEDFIQEDSEEDHLQPQKTCSNLGTVKVELEDASSNCSEGDKNNTNDELTASMSPSELRDLNPKANSPSEKVEAEHEPDYIPSNLIKSISDEISTINVKSDDESASEPTNEGGANSTFKEPWSGSVENRNDCQKDRLPRRSILAKVSRPSLVPMDQNTMMRKVRFADANLSCGPAVESVCQNTEESTKESPKKKLVKITKPKTYKTRIIVSKELV